jgi:hypothetical protein
LINLDPRGRLRRMKFLVSPLDEQAIANYERDILQ